LGGCRGGVWRWRGCSQRISLAQTAASGTWRQPVPLRVRVHAADVVYCVAGASSKWLQGLPGMSCVGPLVSACVQGRPGAPRFVSSTASSLTFEWNAGIVTDRLGPADGFELQVGRAMCGRCARSLGLALTVARAHLGRKVTWSSGAHICVLYSRATGLPAVSIPHPCIPRTPQWRRSTVGAGAEYGWIAAKAVIKGTQCVKKNLDADSAFEVRVRGVNDAGASGWSRHTVMRTASAGASRGACMCSLPVEIQCLHVRWFHQLEAGCVAAQAARLGTAPRRRLRPPPAPPRPRQLGPRPPLLRRGAAVPRPPAPIAHPRPRPRGRPGPRRQLRLRLPVQVCSSASVCPVRVVCRWARGGFAHVPWWSRRTATAMCRWDTGSHHATSNRIRRWARCHRCCCRYTRRTR